MGLENLLNQKINITEIQLDEKPVNRTREMYRNFQDKRFCENGRWVLYAWMGQDHELVPDDRHSSKDQLLGVLIEDGINKPKARKLFQDQKQDFLFKGNWVPYQESIVTGVDGARYQLDFPENATEDQLLGVWVEARLGYHNEAKKRVEEMKKNPKFYNGGGWVQGNARYLSVSALGILVEYELDGEREKAAKSFEDLMNSDLYDREHETWREIEALNSRSFTTSQLLTILAEGIFDKEGARKNYNNLKKNSFDDQMGLWKPAINDISDTYATSDQLLGILVEDMLEEKKHDFSSEMRKPVPEEKSF